MLVQVAGVYAGDTEFPAQFTPGVVAAEQSCDAYLCPQSREVHGCVCRPARSEDAPADLNHRSGCLPAQPVNGPAPPAVEHDIADDGDRRREAGKAAGQPVGQPALFIKSALFIHAAHG
jgi:hypothetical protein